MQSRARPIVETPTSEIERQSAQMKDIIARHRNGKFRQHGNLPKANPVHIVENRTVTGLQHHHRIGIDRDQCIGIVFAVAFAGCISVGLQEVSDPHLPCELEPCLLFVRIDEQLRDRMIENRFLRAVIVQAIEAWRTASKIGCRDD